MFGLTQIIRNSFIRLEGLLYQLFGFTRKLFGQIVGFLSKVLGFSNPGHFLELDEAQGIKSAKTKQPTEAEQAVAPPPPAATRRRSDAKMDYYRNLAREVKKS